MPNRVREFRKDKHWSQQNLADEVGVNRATINNIETGKHIPRVTLARSIAQALDKPLDTIFFDPSVQ